MRVRPGAAHDVAGDQRRADLEQRRHDIEVTLTELDGVERRCREALAALPRADS